MAGYDGSDDGGGSGSSGCAAAACGAVALPVASIVAEPNDNQLLALFCKWYDCSTTSVRTGTAQQLLWQLW